MEAASARAATARRRLAPPPRRRGLVNLTPLIDVVFILLVFFMLATSFLDWRALDLATPSAGAGAPALEGSILLRVDADGNVDLAGEELGPGALERRLEQLLADDPERRVIVAARAGLALEGLVAVIDRVDAAGVREVALARSGTGSGGAP